jgi:argininosuccinate lyase
LVENSIDAVGSRDFILETLANLTVTALDLSQIAEDLVVWSSPGFGVLELPDEFASTSSMMPQKKNPEVPEVIRARASHVLGDFVAAAAAMKAMPSTYSLDFQEVTPKLWDAVEVVERSLKMLAELIPNLKVNSDAPEKALRSFVAATELANTLVRKYNVPFRSAHKIVGVLVKTLIASKKTFTDATPELLRKLAKDTAGITLKVKASDIADAVNLQKIVASHNVTGGPAPSTVKTALAARKKHIAETQSNVAKQRQRLKIAENTLDSTSKSIAEGKIPDNGRFKNSKRMVE